MNATIWSIGKQTYLSILRITVDKGMRLRYCLPVLPWMLTFGSKEIPEFYILLGWGLQFLQDEYTTKHCLAYGKTENPFVEELIIYRSMVFPLYKWFPCNSCHRCFFFLYYF